MDISVILSGLNSWAAVFIALVVLGIVALFVMPWHRTWRCPRCGDEFFDEESAKGHQAVHAEHKPVEQH